MSNKPRFIRMIEEKFLFQNARNFQHFQQQLLRVTILAYLFAAIILVPMSTVRAVHTGWEPLYTIHILNLLLFICLHVFRGRIPYKLKAILLICAFYNITVVGIVSHGVEESYNLYFGLCIILSAIFLSFSQTLIWIIIIIITQIVLFIALLNQWIIPNTALLIHNDKIASWLNSEVAFITLFLTAIIASGSLNKYLQTTIDKLHQNEKKLLAAQKELQALAMKDPLTQLANRRAFDDFFSKEFSRYKRSKSSFCLLVVDLDFFKNINDSYGHDVGDIVLIEVAKCLQKHTRDDELVARIGGEEFVIMLCKCELQQALFAAERIRKSIEQLDINANEKVIKVTSSIGITQVLDDDVDAKALFIRADNALYDAKENGRNQVRKN